MKQYSSRRAFRISAIYAIITAVWIIGSDRLITLIDNDTDHQALLQTAKGLVFISVTAGLIYLLLRRELQVQHEVLTALRSSEARWRSLVENAPDMIFTVDRQANILFINHAPAGLSPPEVIGTSLFEYVPPEHHTTVRQSIKHVFETGQPTSYEIEARGPHDARLWYSTRLAPVRHNDSIDAVILITNDISERKHAEITLQQTFNTMQAIVDASPLAIMHLDPDGVARTWNAAAERLFGWTADEVIGHVLPFVPPEKADEFRELRLRGMQEGFQNIEAQRRRKDGTDIIISISTAPLRDPDGNEFGIAAVIDDITERKRIEGILRENEERFRLFITHAPAALAMFDRDMRYLAVSRRWVADYRLQAGDIIGRSHYDVFPEIPDHWKDAHRRGLAGEVVTANEDRFVRQDGTVQWERWEIRPWHTAEGAVGGIIIFAEDITVAKEANEKIRRLNVELEQRVAQRTAQLQAANHELEAFAYSVSHDLRAPLRAIDGFSRILEEDYGETLDAEGNRLLGVVRSSAQKMDQLITDLLTLSRTTRSEITFTQVDMTTMVQSIFHEIAWPEVQSRFRFSVSPLPDAVADSTLMRQVWSNLIRNAIKYTIPSMEPAIEISGWQDADENIFCVKDTGVGFDPAYAQKLFGVFQRLHTTEEFEGTGVGLAIVQRIIHRHGGRVWAESPDDNGATFYFALPRRPDHD